jgi:hypothetical protein
MRLGYVSPSHSMGVEEMLTFLQLRPCAQGRANRPSRSEHVSCDDFGSFSCECIDAFATLKVSKSVIHTNRASFVGISLSSYSVQYDAHVKWLNDWCTPGLKQLINLMRSNIRCIKMS